MRMTVITSHKNWKAFFSELWEYRDVFLFLGWRSIIIQYKQTALGVAWVLIRPLLTVAIFTFIFSRIVGIESQGTPYPLLVFSGMLVWQFFSDMLMFGSNCFINNQQLISKVYLPRLLLPASRILCSLVDFSIAFVFYLILSMVRYGIYPSLSFLTIPFLIIWLVIITFAVSLFFASIIVRYRDFVYVVPFAVQLGVYITPVGFDLAIAPLYIQYILACNPLTGVISGFRWALLCQSIQPGILVISSLATVFVIIISFSYFKRAEPLFSDVI